MSTYLLTWNPKHWEWENISAVASETRHGRIVEERWSCGRRKNIAKNDRLFLLKQGQQHPKGIIASGNATSEVHEDRHWDPTRAARGETALYIDVDWETILDLGSEPLLQTAELDDGDAPLVNWNTQSSGIEIQPEAAQRIELMWRRHVAAVRGGGAAGMSGANLANIASNLVDEGYFDAQDLEDGRDRQLTEIVQRRGQPEFRSKLIAAYNGRCAITGCEVVESLEAAHIMPFNGRKSHHVANGLLLRGDIHTLFDLNLIGIDPDRMKVALNRRIRLSPYAELDGRRIHVPSVEAQRPSVPALRARWKLFQES